MNKRLMAYLEGTPAAGTILSERNVEMRSDWVNKLGAVRGWLMGAAVVVIALVYLLRR